MFVAMQICVSSGYAYAINGVNQNSRWAYYYLHESVSFLSIQDALQMEGLLWLGSMF